MRNATSIIRYTLRQFRMSPVFTATATLTFALGFGGTTAIFSFMHALMLQSLPVSDSALLYRIGEDDCCAEGGPRDRSGFYSFPPYERRRRNSKRLPPSRPADLVSACVARVPALPRSRCVQN